MKVPKQAKRDARELFKRCLVNGRLDEGRVRAVVKRVIEAKPRGYIGILSHFQRLVKLELDRWTGVVESAVPMKPALQEKMKQSLEKTYGSGLNLQFIENPALIGGVQVRIGNDVYDSSLQARLAGLESSFSR